MIANDVRCTTCGTEMVWAHSIQCPKCGSSHTETIKKTALDIQVGGEHYKTMKIQPAEYNQSNKLGWCEGNCVKYASRHKGKGGAEDVKKILHYAQMLLEFEYGITCEVIYK